jgi:hypothetical protein
MRNDGTISRFPIQTGNKAFESIWICIDRQAAGRHEIWYKSQADLYTTTPNHSGDLPEGTLRAILKEAGIDPNDFLKK